MSLCMQSCPPLDSALLMWGHSKRNAATLLCKVEIRRKKEHWLFNVIDFCLFHEAHPLDRQSLFQVCASLCTLYFTYQASIFNETLGHLSIIHRLCLPTTLEYHCRLFTKSNFNNMNDYVCVNVHIFYTRTVCKLRLVLTDPLNESMIHRG